MKAFLIRGWSPRGHFRLTEVSVGNFPPSLSRSLSLSFHLFSLISSPLPLPLQHSFSYCCLFLPPLLSRFVSITSLPSLLPLPAHSHASGSQFTVNISYKPLALGSFQGLDPVFVSLISLGNFDYFHFAKEDTKAYSIEVTCLWLHNLCFTLIIKSKLQASGI